MSSTFFSAMRFTYLWKGESNEATLTKKKHGKNVETDPTNAAFFKVIEFLEESDENEFYRYGRLEQDDDKKARAIKLAADLIRSDIKDLTAQTHTFFSFDNLNSWTMLSFVPEPLQFFIHSLCLPNRN